MDDECILMPTKTQTQKTPRFSRPMITTDERTLKPTDMDRYYVQTPVVRNAEYLASKANKQNWAMLYAWIETKVKTEERKMMLAFTPESCCFDGTGLWIEPRVLRGGDHRPYLVGVARDYNSGDLQIMVITHGSHKGTNMCESHMSVLLESPLALTLLGSLEECRPQGKEYLDPEFVGLVIATKRAFPHVSVFADKSRSKRALKPLRHLLDEKGSSALAVRLVSLSRRYDEGGMIPWIGSLAAREGDTEIVSSSRAESWANGSPYYLSGDHIRKSSLGVHTRELADTCKARGYSGPQWGPPEHVPDAVGDGARIRDLVSTLDLLSAPAADKVWTIGDEYFHRFGDESKFKADEPDPESAPKRKYTAKRSNEDSSKKKGRKTSSSKKRRKSAFVADDSRREIDDGASEDEFGWDGSDSDLDTYEDDFIDDDDDNEEEVGQAEEDEEADEAEEAEEEEKRGSSRTQNAYRQKRRVLVVASDDDEEGEDVEEDEGAGDGEDGQGKSNERLENDPSFRLSTTFARMRKRILDPGYQPEDARPTFEDDDDAGSEDLEVAATEAAIRGGKSQPGGRGLLVTTGMRFAETAASKTVARDFDVSVNSGHFPLSVSGPLHPARLKSVAGRFRVALYGYKQRGSGVKAAEELLCSMSEVVEVYGEAVRIYREKDEATPLDRVRIDQMRVSVTNGAMHDRQIANYLQEADTALGALVQCHEALGKVHERHTDRLKKSTSHLHAAWEKESSEAPDEEPLETAEGP